MALDEIKNVGKDLVEVCLIPAGVIAGFLMKQNELVTKADKAAYFIFSSGMAYTCPPIILDYLPSLSVNGQGFVNFACAVFGGLALFNIWIIVKEARFWQKVMDKVVGGKVHE